MIKMRKLTTSLLIMAMVLSMGACGSKKEDTKGNDSNEQSGIESDKPAGGRDVDVEILQYKIEIEEALKEATETYMKLYPNVHITVDTMGGQDTVETLYKAKIASGEMPDIFNCTGPVSCKIYADYLEDLSDQPWVDKANAGMLDLDKVGDKIYGMPVTTEGMGLITNKAMFEAVGIDVSTLDTYDKIDEAFNTLQTAIDKGELKDQFPNLQNVTAVQAGATWVLGNHAINVALTPEFNGDVFACADADEVSFEYKQSYIDYTNLQLKYSAGKDDPSKCITIEYTDAVQDLLANGKVAVIQQGNWIYNDVAKIDQTIADSLVYLPVPIKGYKEDCIFSIVSNYWCVNKQSDDDVRDACKHFLNWLYQSDTGKNIVVNEFGFTPVFNNYGDLKPSDPLTQNMVEFLENGKAISMVYRGAPTGEDYTMNVFGANVQGVLAGKMTWDECFDKSAKEWASRRAEENKE